MHPALEAIRLVVFDLDGTLIDSAPDLTAAVDATLTGYGASPAGIDKVRTWVGNGTHALMARALADASRHNTGGAALAHIDPDEAHDVFLEHYDAAPCEHTRLYDGARDCLQALHERGIEQMLITNKPASFLPPILDCLEIAPYFTLTLGGDSLPQKKPDPAPLQHAAKHAGVAPENCLIVGDSRNDIAAGRAAGFRTLAVTYGYNHGEPIADSHPDHMVDSLAELA